MSLPKLNSVPKFEVTVPSTQEVVKFRPFLVKEEKVLMMAVESQDLGASVKAVVDTIDACIEGGIDKKTLTTFDVEYLFTQIRTKSVGESAKFNLKCEKCEEDNEIKIDLDKVVVTFPDPMPSDVIELDESIKLKMKWPRYWDVLDTGFARDENQTQSTFELLIKCIDAVMTDDSMTSMEDVSKAEAMEFVESLTREQLEKVQQFVDGIPKMETDFEYHCIKCAHKNEVHLEGMQNFF